MDEAERDARRRGGMRSVWTWRKGMHVSETRGNAHGRGGTRSVWTWRKGMHVSETRGNAHGRAERVVEATRHRQGVRARREAMREDGTASHARG
jgi:hypothetical protein